MARSGHGRVTEAICPPWCTGHDGAGWQPWQARCDLTGLERDHSDDHDNVGDVRVALIATESFTTTAGHIEMGEPFVDLSVDIPGGDTATYEMTLEQARQLAAALLARVETV